MITDLVLSGGGIKGVAHVGALTLLFESNKLSYDTLLTITGCSIGSFIGLLLCLKIPIAKIKRFMIKQNTSKLIQVDPLKYLPEKLSIADVSPMEKMIKDLLFAKCGNENITMKGLYEQTGIKLFVSVTNHTLKTNLIVGPDDELTCNYPVHTSVMMSMSLPILFPPYLYNGHYYVDGGLSNNFPLDTISPTSDQCIVGIYIICNYDTHFSNLIQYAKSLINLGLHFYYSKEDNRSNQSNVIKININEDEVNAFTTVADNRLKGKMYQIGVKAAQTWLLNENS